MAYEVTIGIPVYNIEKYVPRMMESVLGQTFESIEFLVLDDCGTDSSISIVKEYQQTHARGKDVRIVRQPHNMGLGNARNRIIEEAQGRYLYFLDGDDSIAENAIELLYTALKKYDAEIAYGSLHIIEEFGDEVKERTWEYPAMQFLKENEFACYVYQEYDRQPASTCNFLIDIDIYKRNHIRYKPVNFWEDFTTTIDLPTYIEKAVLLSDLTYNYYLRNGSLSNRQKRSAIKKEEIEKTIHAMDMVKGNSERIKGKPYFAGRMCKVMMSCLYMTCSILKKNDIITPPFTNKEISKVMKSPLSFAETCRLDGFWLKNMALYLLGVIPASLSVPFIRFVAKRRGLG